MALHESTFEYLKPTEDQIRTMALLRELFAELAGPIQTLLPEGPDKTFLLRKLRECAMWANIAVTRSPDGSPRS